MRSDIESFLSLHRIAMIGVSQDPKHFSRAVLRAWRDRGYEVIPVNPKVREVESVFCYRDPRDIALPVDAALLLTPAAEAFCAKNGIDFITGECPLMYLPNQSWPHRLHRWIHARA